MNEEIRIRKLTEEEGGGYLAEYIYLKGCMADGETKIEALEELEKAKKSWIMSVKEFNICFDDIENCEDIPFSISKNILNQSDKSFKEKKCIKF